MSLDPHRQTPTTRCIYILFFFSTEFFPLFFSHEDERALLAYDKVYMHACMHAKLLTDVSTVPRMVSLLTLNSH